MAAIDLQQHALLGHPFTAHPVFGGAVLPGAGQTVAVEETAYRLPAQVNSLPFRQGLRWFYCYDDAVFGPPLLGQGLCARGRPTYVPGRSTPAWGKAWTFLPPPSAIGWTSARAGRVR